MNTLNNGKLRGRNTAVLQMLADGYAEDIRNENSPGAYVHRAMIFLMLEDLGMVSPHPKLKEMSFQFSLYVGPQKPEWRYVARLEFPHGSPHDSPSNIINFFFENVLDYPTLWYYGDDPVEEYLSGHEECMLHDVAHAYDLYFDTTLLKGKW